MTTLIDNLISSRSEIYSGDFSLSDAKACNVCKNSTDCNRAVMLIHSDIDVAVINMDEWKASRTDKQSYATTCCMMRR